jgi:potassium-dependent mechanosensitive channel
MGIGIGIGLREIINNFASGLIILTGRTIKHNDIIQLDQQMGKVVKITIRATVIQTFENAILSIPNSQIISNKLINWTHNNTLVRRDISINIAYNSDTEKVNELLIQIAKNTDHILSKPEPIVLFSDFGESTLNFVLRIWIDNIAFALSTQSSIRTEINKTFRENGIKFAYPQLDIHIDNNKNLDV